MLQNKGTGPQKVDYTQVGVETGHRIDDPGVQEAP